MPRDWTTSTWRAPGPPRTAWTELSGRTTDGPCSRCSPCACRTGVFQVGKARSPGPSSWAFPPRAPVVVRLIGGSRPVGGYVLTRSALQPLRDLGRTVRGILETGRLQRGCRCAETETPWTSSARRSTRCSTASSPLIAAMRGVAGQRRPRPAHPDDAAAGGGGSRPARRAEPRDPREALADCLEESERVVTMLDTLMDISEAETGPCGSRASGSTWPSVVRDAAELYADVAEDQGVTLESRRRPRRCASPPTATACARSWPTSSTTRSSTRRAGGRVEVQARAKGGRPC